jgi:hypothetical protein
VPSQDDHPWNPQMRTTTETILREAMQALVRVYRDVFYAGNAHEFPRCT